MTLERRVLSRTRLLDYLDALDKDDNYFSRSLYLPPGTPVSEAESLCKEASIPTEIAAELTKIVTASLTGAVLFQGAGRVVLVLPPFPIIEKVAAPSVETAPIRSSLLDDHRIGLMLVRLGSYAVGVCEGEKLVSSKVGTGLVHGRHRQGGSSAHRFERHRDKQIEYFLTRVCRHARDHLEPYVKTMDFMAYGGARTTILLLQKQCTFLERINAPTLPPLLDIPEPRQAVLEDAIKRVWSGIVIEWKQS